jgi:hypothetical protein
VLQDRIRPVWLPALDARVIRCEHPGVIFRIGSDCAPSSEVFDLVFVERHQLLGYLILRRADVSPLTTLLLTIATDFLKSISCHLMPIPSLMRKPLPYSMDIIARSRMPKPSHRLLISPGVKISGTRVYADEVHDDAILFLPG